jgi:hypothetical protein
VVDYMLGSRIRVLVVSSNAYSHAYPVAPPGYGSRSLTIVSAYHSA